MTEAGVRLLAPAKINLALEIVRRRDDGAPAEGDVSAAEGDTQG